MEPEHTVALEARANPVKYGGATARKNGSDLEQLDWRAPGIEGGPDQPIVTLVAPDHEFQLRDSWIFPSRVGW